MSLHDAVKASRLDEVKSLIVSGANINEIDKLKRTPLHLAAWTGNLEIMQLLLRTNADLNGKAMDGFLPLHFAAQSQSAEAPACVRLLIKKAKNTLNQRISKGNKSALHLAATKGNEDVCLTLIDLGADTTATTSSGQTAFDLAKTDALRTSMRARISQKEKKDDSAEDKAAGVAVSSGEEGDEDGDNVIEKPATAETIVVAAATEIVGEAAAVQEEVSVAVGSRKRSIDEVEHSS